MNPNTKFSIVFITSLILSFALGGSIGYFAPHKAGCFGRLGGPGGHHGDKMKKVMLNKMSKELSLTDDQKEKVRAIFEAHEPEMKKMHEQMRPLFDAIRNKTRAEIKTILTAEQLPKFEELNARMDERMEKFRGK